MKEGIVVHRSVWGRTPDGALHAATTWYAPTDNTDGIELAGEPGRWRIVGAALLPDGATPVPADVAEVEIAGLVEAAEQAIAAAQQEERQQREADVAALVTAGIPVDVAARLLGGA